MLLNSKEPIKAKPEANDMEFDNMGSGETPKPPPLQDAREYYNNTQRMTEAMIKNPQF